MNANVKPKVGASAAELRHLTLARKASSLPHVKSLKGKHPLALLTAIVDAFEIEGGADDSSGAAVLDDDASLASMLGIESSQVEALEAEFGCFRVYTALARPPSLHRMRD